LPRVDREHVAVRPAGRSGNHKRVKQARPGSAGVAPHERFQLRAQRSRTNDLRPECVRARPGVHIKVVRFGVGNDEVVGRSVPVVPTNECLPVVRPPIEEIIDIIRHAPKQAR